MGKIMLESLRLLALSVAILAGSIVSASAQTEPPTAEETIKDRKNKGTVGVATGQLGAAYPTLAQDMAKVMDNRDTLRVVPMITYGSAGNMEDLLYMRNVDIAFVKADNFAEYRQKHGVNLRNRIHYITRLYDAELHVLVRPEIKAWADLRGKKVNIGVEGNAAHTTVPILMQALGIRFETIAVDHEIGIEMMKKGEISAAIRVGGKPMSTFTKVPPDSGFRFLAISTSDFASKFSDIYALGKLTSEDYPALIPKGETVTTIAAPDILAVYNWPKGTDRYQRVERFIVSFFKNFKKLQERPFHEKWKDVNLAATIPGWTRSEIAERMLQEMATATDDPLREEFNIFLSQNKTASTVPASEHDALFRQFLDWRSRASR
jgi:uncharacterized protein